MIALQYHGLAARGLTAPRLQIRILRSTSEFDRVAASWRALVDVGERSEIFLTYEWARTWWSIFGGDGQRELCIITAWDCSILVGLLPLVRRRLQLVGPMRLELLGTGEDEADEVCSDFLDIVSAPGYEGPVGTAIGAALREDVGNCDIASFRNVAPQSLLVHGLSAMAATNGQIQRRDRGRRHYFIDLSRGSYQDYLARLSKRRRKRSLYYQRRLQKDGFTERRLTRSDEVGEFLSELARLSCLRRHLQGKSSAFESSRFRRFHAELAPKLWERGWLDLRLFYLAGKPVAALYCFLFRGSIAYYQSGFDTEAVGNTSAGLVTLNRVIEWGFERKLRRFDFLVGAPGSYKEDYPCVVEPVIDLVTFSNTVVGQVARMAEGVRSLLRSAVSGSSSSHVGKPAPPATALSGSHRIARI